MQSGPAPENRVGTMGDVTDSLMQQRTPQSQAESACHTKVGHVGREDRAQGQAEGSDGGRELHSLQCSPERGPLACASS